MASLLNSVNNRKITKRGATMDVLKAEDCICPVCLSILIEPVTMPCNHELCMPCFKQNVQETSLSCPMCRMRISTWTRKATKQNNLINQERWASIQKMFPEKVKQRLEGKDDSLLDDDLLPVEKPLIASPGAIRKEFEYQLQRLQEERHQQEILDQQASEQLIKKIQAEEQQLEGQRRKQLEKQKLSDEILARTLNEQLKDLRGNGNDNFVLKECLKAYRLRAIRTSLGRKFIQEQTVARSKSANDVLDEPPPGNIFLKNVKLLNNENKHIDGRSSSPVIIKEILKNKSSKSKENVEVIYQENKAEEDISKDKENLKKPKKCRSKSKSPTSSRSRSCSASSDDSISQELTHFKPIKTAPKTPPKKLPGGSVIETKIVRITPLKCDENNVNMTALKQSPIVKRQLAILDREHRLKVAEMSKATETALENRLNPMPPASKRLTFDDSPETVQRNRRKIFFPLDSNLTIEEQTSTYTYQPAVVNSTKRNTNQNSPGRVYLMNSKSAKHKKYKNSKIKDTRSESVSELMKAGNVLRDTPFKLPTKSNLIEKPIIKDSEINTRQHSFLFESESKDNEESSFELNISLATDSDNTDDEIELNLNKVLKKASIRKKLLIIESDHEDSATEKKPKKRKQHYANIENTKENIKSTTNQIEHEKHKACSKSVKTNKNTENSQHSTKYSHKSRNEMEKMQEEIDYQFALRLQQQLDKEGQNIIIRKRDTEDWYEFRSRSEKSLVPCKKSRCSYKCK